MSNQQLIIDKGSFVADTQSFALTESFETILNIHKTVKEYRDYAQPGTTKWEEYIEEFFHIFGFSTLQQSQRIMLLSDINSNGIHQAVAGVVLPNEDKEQITTWLSWASLLSYAASHYKVDWGIVITGLEMKVYYFKKVEFTDHYFWTDLDQIICGDRSDNFFTIYKLLSYIKGRNSSPLQPTEKLCESFHFPPHSTAQQAQREKPQLPRKTSYHTSEMPKVLINILDVNQEMDNNGLDFSKACDVIANRKSVFSTTIRDACTRRIKLNTEGFRILASSKSRFVAYLSQIFPEFSDTIKQIVME